MSDRRGLNAHLAGELLVALGLVFAASVTLFAANHDSSQPLYDIVAVGRTQGKIVLATLALPAEKLTWRFREIPVSPSHQSVQQVALSADGSVRTLDLTERITGISSTDAFPPQHRLPWQRFPYASNGKVCLLDDLGDLTQDRCREAAAAVIHEEGRVLYALEDGRLIVVAADGDMQEELPYHLPRGSRFQLLAGNRQDGRDFLVLVTEKEARPGRTALSVTKIVDPRAPAVPLGTFPSDTTAALHAQLDFSDAGSQPESGSSSEPEVSAATIDALVAHLDEETRPAEVAWSFYRVVASPELYAPVLEFAPGEPDYPSDVDIWSEVRPLARGTTRQAYEAAYASMGDRRWSRCASYVRTLSYPGSWLIEYWFYYPFDEGRPHPHFHDSEHIFVEVDKLGGTVRNVFASDHDSFSPNDIYSTLARNSSPISLPLYATVELAKHAMAPDLNHDGRFTPGADDNVHLEPYSFWGLRDRDTKFHFMMEPYRASMSLPRDRGGRFAFKSAEDFFPGLDVPAEHQVCTEIPFPADPPCPHCDPATAEMGLAHLTGHPDAAVPENIYKPYVIPWRELRAGVGIYDWSQGRGQLSLALVGDFRHMTGGLVTAPARLGVEFIWTPLGRYVPVRLGGKDQLRYSKSTIYTGLRVERLVTNAQGFYFAATPEWADVSTTPLNSVPSPSPLHWQYGGLSYHLGYLIELPSAHKGNFTNQIGIVIQNSFAAPILFEWRVSLGFLRWRGRHDFGARRTDRNPYE